MSKKKKEPFAILFDVVRCAGCRKCIGACQEKQGFGRDPDEVKELSSTAYTAMTEKEIDDYDYSIRNMCRHCLHPACESVCPVGALVKTELGPVVYDADKCIGCRYCMVACPFSIPRYEWDKPVPAVRKCDMCFDRLQEGKVPACAEACEYEATLAGPRSEMLRIAKERITEDPDEYLDHVYGEFEIGGTSVLFLAPAELPELGFKEILGTEPLPDLTMQQLNRVPGIVVGGGAVCLAIWWITNRRDEVQTWEAQGRPEHGHGPRTGGNGRF